MSLILDALRKSDRQRTRHVAERLRDGPPVARAPAFSAMAIGMLGITVALVAVTIAVLVVLRTPAEPNTTASATGTSAEIMENALPATAQVRALDSELASPPLVLPPAAQPAPPKVDVAPPVRAVTAEELGAPPYMTLPADVRARLPSLHMDVHAWASDPRERFVLINLRRYAEGDRTAEGALVRHILPEGVVLEHEGLLFSLPRQ